MTTSRQRTTTTPRSATTSAGSVEFVLELLRKEWRSGGRDRLSIPQARREVERLQERAATQQAELGLKDLASRLARYKMLPSDRQKDELTSIANNLKALAPHLAIADSPALEMGKRNASIAPTRAGAEKPAPKPVRAAPAVIPLSLDAPVTDLPRVGTKMAKILEGHKARIRTVGDLLNLAPSRHIDYSRTVPITAALRARPGEDVTVRGELIEVKEIRGSGPPRVQARLADGSGWVRITWFSTFIARELAVGDEIVIAGQVQGDYGPMSFTNPEWERAGAAGLSTGRLIPVYPLTKDLGQKTLRRLTRAALDATLGRIPDHLPGWVRERFRLIDLATAYEQIHYPDSYGNLKEAQDRLAFDDLLSLQIGHVLRRRDRKAAGGLAMTIDQKLLSRFLHGLPFRLTHAQQGALNEILADMASPQPMTRLVQGDVGSGKTVVAAAAALIATANATQSAVMAPTEILAEQHYHSLRGLFAHLSNEDRPAVAILTGSSRTSERRDIQEGLAAGEIDILVGTHALIQETVTLARVGLAVVDEQHRFGVRQRADLPNRGDQAFVPHTLAMSATPIPRTLNMVINGDLDVSVINELPPGRVPIETRRYVDFDRQDAYDLVREQIRLGHQAFVICPLVEESEAIEAKAAVAEAERLQREVFPDLRIALLHGRMSGREKDATMTAFRDRDYDILVATSVIEVGIDVPNATVMMVEGADRFGLAQLHQFRGRVGRGGSRSYCLLLADESSPDGEERLQAMVDTTDGFVLAEKDLELRGPGDFIGTRQSGLPEMAWVDGSFDTRLLNDARLAAEAILERDPDLAHPDHEALARRFARFWNEASPDIPV